MAICTIGCLALARLWVITVGFGLDNLNLLIFALLVLLPSCGATYAVKRWSPGRFTNSWAVTLITAVLIVSFVPWHPRQLFVWRLAMIPSGATESEVRQRMNGYLGGSKADWAPEALRGQGVTETISYGWNDTDGRFNSDVGEVFLAKGRVVGTSFLPD